MIVVTGATGTVGTFVAEHLNAAGEKYRVISRHPDKVPQRSNVEVAKAAYDDKAALATAFKGATKAFLLTPSTPESTGWHKNLIDAAKAAGVKHVVRLSVLGADKNSPVMVAKWHAESDEYLKASGMAWTILHPTSFVTNYLAHVPTIKKDGAFYGCYKNGALATIDPRDIALVAVKALTASGHEGKAYPLTGQYAMTQAQVAEKIGAFIGKTVKYVDVPPEQIQKSLVAAHMPEWLAKDLVMMATFTANGPGKFDPTLGTLLPKTHAFHDFLERWGAAFR